MMGPEIKTHPTAQSLHHPVVLGGPGCWARTPGSPRAADHGLADRTLPLFAAKWVDIFGVHSFPGSSQDSCWRETQAPWLRQCFLGTWVGHQGQVQFFLQFGLIAQGSARTLPGYNPVSSVRKREGCSQQSLLPSAWQPIVQRKLRDREIEGTRVPEMTCGLDGGWYSAPRTLLFAATPPACLKTQPVVRDAH